MPPHITILETEAPSSWLFPVLSSVLIGGFAGGLVYGTVMLATYLASVA